MQRVFYFGDYVTSFSEKQNRTASLAGSQKMAYLIKAVNQLGKRVCVVSPSWTQNHFGIYRGASVRDTQGNRVKYFFTFGDCKIRVLKYVKCGISLIATFNYLLFNMRKEDTLIVYHSLEYMSLIKFLRSIKKISIIYEIEELYGSLSIYSAYKEKEIAYLKEYNKFIFASDLLPKFLNKSDSSHVIYYGAYATEKVDKSDFGDGKIHVVYAGTFDEEKGGAYCAIEAARFLDERYVVHVLGFGNQEQIDKVRSLIEVINISGGSEVRYEGAKTGMEYYQFLSMCDIGVSCQKTEGDFNDTSFPSKVLVYLSLDLKVVVTDIPVLRESKIKEYLTFSMSDAPEDVAKAILECTIKERKYESEEMEKIFMKGMSELLN